MQHETKKIALIVNELLTMLLLEGNGNLKVEIQPGENITNIFIEQHNCTYDQIFLEDLRHDLNTGRQLELEHYYWQLISSDESGEEMTLVGAMIDEAIVEMKDGDLFIKISRKNELEIKSQKGLQKTFGYFKHKK